MQPDENKREKLKGDEIQQSGSSNGHSKRGRKTKKSSKVDVKAKLEKSRQSARECRARKKLRYQYLEDLVTKREKSVLLLKKELDMHRELCKLVDEGKEPAVAIKTVEEDSRRKERRSR